MLQNKLFDEKESIKATIKIYTTNILLNHKDAVTMREILTLNIAMLEQAKAKVIDHENDALVETMCETF